MSRFVKAGDVATDTFDWGSAGMRCAPSGTGCQTFVVMDVEIGSGRSHAFHRHPDQDEMIIVKSGRIEQWIEQERTELGPGDSVYIDKDVVHATYNDGSEPAELQVVAAEAVTWNDGSIGCPEPGMMYTQALVPGYRVLLEAGGEELAFHATESGDFRFCADPQPPLEGTVDR